MKDKRTLSAVTYIRKGLQFTEVNISAKNLNATCSNEYISDVYLLNILFTTLNFIKMEKKEIDLSPGMPLNPPPLIYLHEYFKEKNLAGPNHLENNWVWYSNEDLKNIADMIAQIKKGDPNKNGDGVRLYYGIYNDKVCEYLKKQNNGTDYSEYENRNTVFFVPTYEGASKDEHIDDITPKTLEEWREKYIKKEDLPENMIEGGYNVGHICPPPKTPTGECANPTGAVL